eukprot:1142378-Pyramimonas_sp.AAC.1
MLPKVRFAIPAEFTVQIRANVLGEVKEVAGAMLGMATRAGAGFAERLRHCRRRATSSRQTPRSLRG